MLAASHEPVYVCVASYGGRGEVTSEAMLPEVSMMNSTFGCAPCDAAVLRKISVSSANAGNVMSNAGNSAAERNIEQSLVRAMKATSGERFRRLISVSPHAQDAWPVWTVLLPDS